MKRRLFIGAGLGLFAGGAVRAQSESSPEAVEEAPTEILNPRGPKPEALHFCPPNTSTGGSTATLIQLLANPAAHDRKRVKVVGFVNIEFEGNALYLNREAYDAALFDLSVHLDLRMDDMAQARRSLNHRYVEIIATFEFDPEGWPTGTLKEISSIENWPSHRDFQRAARGARLPYAAFRCPSGDGR